jgi:hypothetical protein
MPIAIGMALIQKFPQIFLQVQSLMTSRYRIFHVLYHGRDHGHDRVIHVRCRQDHDYMKGQGHDKHFNKTYL